MAETFKRYAELYNGILASIPSSVLLLDRRLRVVSANRNFLEKARRDEAATLGRMLGEVFPPVLLAYTKLEERVRESFNTAQPVEGGEMTYRAPGLPARVYYYRLTPIRDDDGVVENVMLLMDDITERVRLGEEVRRAERHLASVVESANDIVVSMDSSGRIKTWNRAAEEVSGLRSGEVFGRHLADLCTDELQPNMRSLLTRLAEGEPIQNTEINLAIKAGQEVPVAWAFSAMRDDEGHMVGMVAVGRDLTERRHLEAQLIQSAKMASLGVMAGGIAHEIRNPLGICSAAAQLMLERPDDSGLQREAAEKIYAAVQRASYIVENLLKFARPPEESQSPLGMNSLLEETLSLMASQATLRQIKIEKRLSPDLPPVLGNKSLLQQVFTNMILNAANAMPKGGQLTVVSRVDPHSAKIVTPSGQPQRADFSPGGKAEWRAPVEIQFIDTGLGIAQDDLNRVFDPFFTTMPVGRGMGLGLSISYAIVQAHKGSIEVDSQVGQGTTFTVRLPLHGVGSQTNG